jgi:outer membrane protein assembly factor BamB/plastocyanin
MPVWLRLLLGAALPVTAALLLLPGSASAAASCATAETPGGDWPVYGRDLGNSRFQAREKVISAADAPFLTPAWVFSTEKSGGEGDITGTPIVSGGCVYVATSRSWVFALNADTGAVVWKTKLPYGGTVYGSVALGKARAMPRRCAGPRGARRQGKARGRARSSARRRGARRRAGRRCAARWRGGRRGVDRRRAGRSADAAARKRRARRRGSRRRGRGKLRSAVFVTPSRTREAEGCPKGDPCKGPYAVALDRKTGKILWATPPFDTQDGADLYASPLVFEGTLMVGVSGGSAELGDEADRIAFQGSMNFLNAATGRMLRKTWTIHPPKRPDDQFAGATIWSTPAIDRREKVAYVGAGNPFRPQAEHAHANAVLKFNVNRRSRGFGKIIGSYKGDIDEYIPGFSQLPCYDFPGNNPPFYPQGLGACGDIDLDFGASPNLITGPDGRKLVGEGQKSGVYHVFEAATMKPAWKQIVGPPTPVGGIVGSTAYDGQAVYGPITAPGYTWSIEAANGDHRWFGVIGDGAHWGPPVAVANGVVYTVDLTGFLDAYDARTGVLLARRPLALGGGGPASLSWGGVAVARNKVYAGVGLGSLSQGFLVAYERGGPTDLPRDAEETIGGILGGGGGGEQGPVGSAIIAGPGATSTGYATPVMITRVGGPLSFVNLDPVQHDVTSEEKGPDGRPLFASKLSGIGEVAPVEGMDRVKSGQTYPFLCSIHPGMRGNLIVR